MSLSRRRCPMCARDGVARFAIGEHTVLACGACGLEWCSPVPPPERLQRIYEETYHPEYQRDWKAPVERRRVALQIRALVPDARTILDVGCGFGHFLDEARGVGFHGHGLDADPARVAATVARGHAGTVGFLDALPPGVTFDAVTLSHVIEHVTDPIALLERCAERVRPGGVFYVETPNYACLRAVLSGRRFTHYAPPEHITYFRRRSLARALERAGLEVVRIDGESGGQAGKDVLSYFLRLRFLRSPESMLGRPDAPFAAGRAGLVKAPLVAMSLCAGTCLAPLLLGGLGENLAGFARRVVRR